MNDPKDGKYTIQNITVPVNGYYGANEGDVVPVVPGGRDIVWILKNLEDGKVILTLEDYDDHKKTRNSVKFDEHDVRVTGRLAATPWIIRGPPGGPYAIEFPTDIIPGFYWVADNSKPDFPVILRRQDFAPEVWAFNPWADGAE